MKDLNPECRLLRVQLEAACLQGIKEALIQELTTVADDIKGHWNSSDQMVNQKEQAFRSSHSVYRRIASLKQELI